MNEEELKETTALIAQNLETDLMPPVLSHEQLREWLAGKVGALMKHDFHKLLAILYRIDVHENNVKRVFDEYRPDEIPFMLAELVIQRQLQKVKTRIAYRDKGHKSP